MKRVWFNGNEKTWRVGSANLGRGKCRRFLKTTFKKLTRRGKEGRGMGSWVPNVSLDTQVTLYATIAMWQPACFA